MASRTYAIIVQRVGEHGFSATQPDFGISVAEPSLEACVQEMRLAIRRRMIRLSLWNSPAPAPTPIDQVAGHSSFVVSIELDGDLQEPRGTPSVAPTNFASAGRELDVLSRALEPLVGATLADIRAAFIEATIRRCGGSVQRAADLLGVHNSTLYRERQARRMR